jgi:hypothetical protein
MNNIISMKDFLTEHDTSSEEPSSSFQETTSKESTEATSTELKGDSGEQHLSDIQNLTRTELGEKYKAEYSSWRNMKQRAKAEAIIRPEFDDFCSFLRHVGPKPAPNYTLDRIDNENPSYGPGLVRWASKKTQNNNRSNTLFLVDADGTRKTLTEWAQTTGEKPDTLRRRRRDGWSDPEVIHGRSLARDRVWNMTPWPVGKEKGWERLYQDHATTGKLSRENENRVGFLHRFSRYEVIGYTRQLEELERINAASGPTEKGLARIVELKKLIKEFRGYVTLAERKRQRQNSLQRKKSFANRTGGLGREIESALWELTND